MLEYKDPELVLAEARWTAARLREEATTLDDAALRQLFLDARSHNGWLERPVTEAQLRAVYELACMAPTSMNCSPARFLFLHSPAARERLRPALSPGNLEKMMSAPVVAVIATDHDFHEHLPQLFPHRDVRGLFADNAPLRDSTAFRNATLQAAWLMLAARASGLDCGPVSGFDNGRVDAEFFAGSATRSNFLCGIGYGDPDKVFQRLPRLPFDEACRLL